MFEISREGLKTVADMVDLFKKTGLTPKEFVAEYGKSFFIGQLGISLCDLPEESPVIFNAIFGNCPENIAKMSIFIAKI